MNQWFEKGNISEKSRKVMRNFFNQYHATVVQSGNPERVANNLFAQFVELLNELIEKPFSFAPYHKMITKPFNYYQFGMDFTRPLINASASQYLGGENLKRIQQQIHAKENVIFLANHQTEIDPHLINLLLEKDYPELGKEMIFVAGDRVISDHLAIPMSMGRNLLCIYSKKHINNPPERLEEKRHHNKKTMQLMSHLLNEGGKCIYVAPSGGRDRPGKSQEFPVAPFDAQSIEMFYLMTKKAKATTHFYPLSLLTYRVLPPPNDVEVELGEERFTKYAGVYAAFGKEIDMINFPGQANDNKLQMRLARSEYIWSLVDANYSKLKKLKDQNEKHI